MNANKQLEDENKAFLNDEKINGFQKDLFFSFDLAKLSKEC